MYGIVSPAFLFLSKQKAPDTSDAVYCNMLLFYGFKQNSAYSGMLLMLFSKPKFLADTRMA